MDRAASRLTTHAKSFTTQNCFWDAAWPREARRHFDARGLAVRLRALCGRSHDGTDDSPHAPNRSRGLVGALLVVAVSKLR